MDRPITTRIVALFLGSFACASAHAAVVGVTIASREPIGARDSATPAFERIAGEFRGELDPKDPHNALITDLALAPLNARGKVEYSATFALSKPVDPGAASGVLFYDTPNRGRGGADADPAGHVHLVAGWQADIAPAAGRQSARVPVARNADGSPVTGPVIVRFVDMPAGARSVPLLRGFGAPVAAPLPASLDTTKATLVRKRADVQRGEPIASTDWAYADCTRTAFPGEPRADTVCLKGGFDPQYAYELRYVAKDPLVLGIGFAAVRDLVAFLRYGTDSAAAPNPLAGRIQHTIGTGVSQAGNFIRSFIRLGFNQAEDGRIVFDGVNPHIAPRQVPLNVRFGVPGGAAGTYEAGSEGALWWGDYADPRRLRKSTSLLDRCRVTQTCPKVMETFGSAEFWGLRLSPDLVGVDAKADIPLPANVRRYYFPGITHGGGDGGFPIGAKLPAKVEGCELPANPNPAAYMMRALTRALVDWVVTGKEPPTSRYPQLAKGELVPPTRTALGFPRIPGAPSPDDKINTFVVHDFGKEFRYDDVSGVMTTLPPRILSIAPSLVPRVDADGNETSGVASVQHRVPTGTYLGWNVDADGYYKGAECGFNGSFIPFAQTRAERVKSGDPRLSLEERYGTHAGFVAKVREAAAQLQKEGFILQDDIARIVQQAEESEVLAR